MAISFVGSAVASSSPNAQTSVDISGISLQSGDLILVGFAVGDTSASDSNLALTDYTEVADLFSGTDTNDTDLWVGYKYSTGSETAVGPFTAVGGTNASNAATVMVFRGVRQAVDGGPFDVASTTATGIDTSNADPPSIDWSTAGVWAVIVGATGHTGGASATYTAPTNYTTNFAQRAHNDTVDVLIGMGYNSSPADPENPGAFTAATIGTASANSWCAVTMALVPASITPTRGRVSFAELEVPFVATRGRISFAEFEIPTTATRGRISFSELEVPGISTRGRISFAEIEVPSLATPTRGLLSWAELEAPAVLTRGRISFGELEVPDVGGVGDVHNCATWQSSGFY